jgi:hypothetical protein
MEDKSRKLAETQPDSPQRNGMDIAIEGSKLRQALDVVVDQIDLAVHPHQIERVDLPPLVCATFKCLPVALGLIWQPGFPKLVSFTQVGAGRFVHWLIAERHLHQQPEITNGCLVLYFAGPDWRHAGIGLPDGRVVSKWGCNQLLRHPVDQVPAECGDTVRAYRHPGGARALELYHAFVDRADMSRKSRAK